MMRSVFILSAVLLTAATGCKKQSSDGAAGAGSAQVGSATAGSTAATGSAAGAGSTTPGAGSAPVAMGSDGGSAAMAAAGAAGASAEAMAHRAGMCPSTVLGTTTTEAVKGKAVAVTIVSSDPDAIAAIQKRTDKLLAEKKVVPVTGTGHDQNGTHGGGAGLCPVHVPDGATASAKHQAKGVVVMITPKERPEDLAREIDGRIARAADWVKANVKEGDKGNQGGVGGGKGDDGSNHSGKGDGKGHDRKKGGGSGGGKGTGGGTGGGDSSAKPS